MTDEKNKSLVATADEVATTVDDAPNRLPEAAVAGSSADKEKATTEAAMSAGGDEHVEDKDAHKKEEKVEEKAAETADKEKENGNTVAEENTPAKTDDDKPEDPADIEMKDTEEPPAKVQENNDKEPEQGDSQDTAVAAPSAPDASTATPAKGSSKSRPRKSSVGTVGKVKALSRKGSKARILHLDAKPGDHYFVKLKGYPQWPCIICDEDMLPQSLIKSRPVTAMRPDGTYREDYADGGRRAHDRTYPVMYLFTNEFGWVPNTDIVELDPDTVLDLKTDKMRKDLQAAHDLAAENNDLSYYKDLLQKFQEEIIEQTRAKAAKAATPKSKKKKPAAEDEPEDEDVEMADVAGEEDEDEEEAETPKSQKKAPSSKKRKAAEPAETPQRSDSIKRPKIKITTNSTPKTNGTTPASKTGKSATETKSSKKAKKPAKETAEKKAKKETTPPEPELTAEEKHERKQKEVLFFRHKLQKGLLTRDQEPKPEEMKTMSEYITKLESLTDLEVSIIRSTKIHKVLKAILKLETIPKEDEFRFKTRSQALLENWNKQLATEGGEPPSAGSGPASATVPATTVSNGAAVNGTSKAEDKGEKKATNGAAGKEKKAANGSIDDEEEKEEEEKEEEAKPEENHKNGEGVKKLVEKPAADKNDNEGGEKELEAQEEKEADAETKAPEAVEASA